jgi:hypothetical protein
MVLLEGIELSTSPLPRGCSTTELQQRPARKDLFFLALWSAARKAGGTNSAPKRTGNDIATPSHRPTHVIEPSITTARSSSRCSTTELRQRRCGIAAGSTDMRRPGMLSPIPMQP